MLTAFRFEVLVFAERSPYLDIALADAIKKGDEAGYFDEVEVLKTTLLESFDSPPAEATAADRREYRKRYREWQGRIKG